MRATSGVLFTISAFGQSSELWNAEKSKAMLVRGIEALAADKARALASFNNGEAGFLDGDLYPFCIDTNDDKVVANDPVNDQVRFLGCFETAVDAVFGMFSRAAVHRRFHDDRGRKHCGVYFILK